MLKKCITVVSVMLALVLSLIIICEISDAQAMGGGTITAAQTEKTQDTSPQETTIQAIPLSNPESDPASETGVWKPAGEETTAPEENTSDATVPVPEPTTVPVPVACRTPIDGIVYPSSLCAGDDISGVGRKPALLGQQSDLLAG